MALGASRSVAAVAAVIAAVGCKRGSPPPEPARTLQVYGADIGAGWANVKVLRGGAAADARVVVNGAVLERSARETSLYSGQLPAQLAPGERSGAYAGGFARVGQGDPITLGVTWRGLHVTGVGLLPETPVLTSPASGAGLAPEEDLVVTWTSASDPDDFEVLLDWSCGPSCGTGARFAAAGSDRRLTIPFAALPSGTIQVRLRAYDDGTFTGDYAPWEEYPGMNIQAEAGPVVVSR